MLTKSYPVQFKAETTDDAAVGRFKALVSVFGNVDLQGDRVMPEAFDGTLEAWRKSGDMIPVIWSHDWGNPFAHIGGVDPSKARVTPEGLEVEGEIDLTNAFGAQVHSLMARRLVKEFSFGYRVDKEQMAKDGANNLEALTLIEVGPTLKGANPATDLRGVKAELEAASRRDAIAQLAERVDALEAKLADAPVIASWSDASGTQTVTVTTTVEEGEAKTEEPSGAKDEEPVNPNAEVLAALDERLVRHRTKHSEGATEG